MDRRIQVLRALCQRKNNKLCIKIYDKKDEDNPDYTSIVLCSKGLGANYAKENQLKHKWNGEKTIITYKAHNGQDLPLPRYYKTTIYTDDQRQLLWLYAEDKGVKWVKGFKVIGANTANKDYYERLLKEKVEKEINYMFYELYTKRMSAEAAQEIAKATYEKVKNEYELGKGHLSNEEDKNLREWIYGGIHEGAEIIKIITDFLPAGKAAKVLKTIKESWNNNGDYSKSITTQTAE